MPGNDSELIVPPGLMDKKLPSSDELNELNEDDINRKFREIIKTFIVDRPNVSELVFTEGSRIFYEENGKFKSFDIHFSVKDSDIVNHITQILLERFKDDEERVEEIEKKINREGGFNFSYLFEKINLRCNWSIGGGNSYFRLRRIMDKVPPPNDLGLPEIIRQQIRTWQSGGLIVVSAPVGEGKSTTIASIVQELAYEDCLNIVTLEDPKEYIYDWGSSIIEQREIGNDLDSYMTGISQAMRQKPNIVIVQEMTDPEIVRATMHLLKKGIMVITTLHTPDTPTIFESILDAHLESERDTILSMLRENFKCFISQRLIPKANGKGRVAIFEVLNNTSKAKGYLEPGANIKNIHQIMETDGNLLFWQDIIDKIEFGDITIKDGLVHCPPSRKKVLEQVLNVSGG